jgi:hypothetical protein
MNTKILLILLVVMFGAIGLLSIRLNSSSVLGANTGSGGSISLTTKPNPLKPGPATFLIDIKDKSGKKIDDASVSYDINMTTMDMGAQSGKASSQGNGRYTVPAKMTMRGPWKVTISAKMTDGSDQSKDFTVYVQ